MWEIWHSCSGSCHELPKPPFCKGVRLRRPGCCVCRFCAIKLQECWQFLRVCVVFGIWGAFYMAVRAAAMSFRNCLSAKAFDCDDPGAVYVASVPFNSKDFGNSFAFCSLAPSVWKHFSFLSHMRWIFASDYMIALPASLLLRIICTSVQPNQGSTRIWMNRLPSVFNGVIGPGRWCQTILPPTTHFCSDFLLDRGSGRFALCAWGKDCWLCVVLSVSMHFMAYGYSFLNHSRTLLCVCFIVSCATFSLEVGASIGLFFLVAVRHSLVLSEVLVSRSLPSLLDVHKIF